MSHPDWPADLPRPRRDGYAASRIDQRRRRATEIGAAEYRRELSLAPRPVALSIDCSRVQKQVFDRFFDHTCAGGTLYFRMPDWTEDGWPLLDEAGQPLLDENDVPLLSAAVVLCAWSRERMPEETMYGTRFLIGFEVEVMP